MQPLLDANKQQCTNATIHKFAVTFRFVHYAYHNLNELFFKNCMPTDEYSIKVLNVKPCTCLISHVQTRQNIQIIKDCSPEYYILNDSIYILFKDRT